MKAGWRGLLLAVWLGCAAASHAVLLTPEEAAGPGNRVCKPVRGGMMLDCVDQAAPTPEPTSDPGIQPLPVIQYDASQQIPQPTVEPPIKPALDPIPEKLDSDSLRIGWDINFGTTAQYWEVLDNDTLAVRSQDFTPRTLLASSTQAVSARAVSVQSGEYQLQRLAPGRHILEIRLCNTDTDGSPLCTSVSASTWVGGAEEVLGKPSVPEIEWLPNVSTGDPVELTWHMWWGTPGHYWQVLDQGKVVYESTAFSENTEHTQTASTTLKELAAGNHAFTVRLCSKLDCADSDIYPLEVMLAGVDSSALPRVVLQGKVSDSWLVAWSVPVMAAAKQPVRWRWLDADSGEPIGVDETRTRVCDAAADDAPPAGNPGARFAPIAQTRSYCGQTRMLTSDAPLHLSVEVCWATERACRRSAMVSLTDSHARP